jgi:hypothetical protein
VYEKLPDIVGLTTLLGKKNAIQADKLQRYVWCRYRAIVIILKKKLQNEWDFRILFVFLQLHSEFSLFSNCSTKVSESSEMEKSELLSVVLVFID